MAYKGQKQADANFSTEVERIRQLEQNGDIDYLEACRLHDQARYRYYDEANVNTGNGFPHGKTWESRNG